MVTVQMTLLMRVKVSYIPLGLQQETLEDQVTWSDIAAKVQLTEEEKLTIGLEEVKAPNGMDVIGATWKPVDMTAEVPVELETGYAKFLLNYLNTAKAFTAYDVKWAAVLALRLKKVL